MSMLVFASWLCFNNQKAAQVKDVAFITEPESYGFDKVKF